MVIAHRNFRDEEYEKPRKVLEDNGASIVVASSGLAEAKGMLGASVKPDLLVEQVSMDDYDAVIFVGGGGTSEYWDDPNAHRIAKDAYFGQKIVAAICIAPVTLARAGILKDKYATVFPAEISALRAQGAICTGSKVVRDGDIITGSVPEAAHEFGEAVAEALSDKKPIKNGASR